MKRRRWLLGLAVAALAAVVAGLVVRTAFESEGLGPEVRERSLASGRLGEERPYLVHLPASYESAPERRYPVVFVLDGASQSSHTAASARRMAAAGELPELLVVGVPNVGERGRPRDYTPPGMRQDDEAAEGPEGEGDAFLDFLERELIPAVERELRTTGERTLAGWSRGGLFVVYALTEHPELFESYHAHSPALWRSGSEMVARLERFLSERPELASELFLSLGGEENPKMTEAFRSAVAALEARAPAGLRWRAEITPGAGHQENPERATPVALSWAAATGPAPVR
jgi:predicted alpha/beta superfamily hydrolase